MTIKLVIAILILFGVVGAALGVTKQRSALAGFFVGSTLGLAGLILFCMLPDGERVAAAGASRQPKAWWKAEVTS